MTHTLKVWSLNPDPTAPDGRPVSRCVACLIDNVSNITVETPEGRKPVPPPEPPSAVERAMLRRRHDAMTSDDILSTAEGILEAALLGDFKWEHAVRATRSVGAFRLPPTVSTPWRPNELLEVRDLLGFAFIEVGGAPALNLLVTTPHAAGAIAPGERMRLQVVLAPSGLIEQIERQELVDLVGQGDAAFDEIERS